MAGSACANSRRSSGGAVVAVFAGQAIPRHCRCHGSLCLERCTHAGTIRRGSRSGCWCFTRRWCTPWARGPGRTHRCFNQRMAWRAIGSGSSPVSRLARLRRSSSCCCVIQCTGCCCNLRVGGHCWLLHTACVCTGRHCGCRRDDCAPAFYWQ